MQIDFSNTDIFFIENDGSNNNFIFEQILQSNYKQTYSINFSVKLNKKDLSDCI
jgi:hypothetical protein